MSRYRANYTEEEVRVLIEEYGTFRELLDTGRGLSLWASITDLDAVLERLPLKYWEVVLLHGLLGFTQYETARLLQVSQQAVAKRYRHGLAEVLYLINGGC